MKRAYSLTWILLTILLFTVPAQAAPKSSAETTRESMAIITTPATQIVANTATGAIKPISPDQIKTKVDAMEGWIFDLMAPIIHLMSKLSLILAVLLMLAAVFARELFGRAFMVVGSVILGMTIFSNVEVITDTIQWLGQWLGQ